VSTIFSPAFSQSSRDSSIEDPPTPQLPSLNMSFIERGGKGIVPQIDAPVSASNGGERVSLYPPTVFRCGTRDLSMPKPWAALTKMISPANSQP
jgi:hypothetical protein